MMKLAKASLWFLLALALSAGGTLWFSLLLTIVPVTGSDNSGAYSVLSGVGLIVVVVVFIAIYTLLVWRMVFTRLGPEVTSRIWYYVIAVALPILLVGGWTASVMIGGRIESKRNEQYYKNQDQAKLDVQRKPFDAEPDNYYLLPNDLSLSNGSFSLISRTYNPKGKYNHKGISSKYSLDGHYDDPEITVGSYLSPDPYVVPSDCLPTSRTPQECLKVPTNLGLVHCTVEKEISCSILTADKHYLSAKFIMKTTAEDIKKVYDQFALKNTKDILLRAAAREYEAGKGYTYRVVDF